MAQVPTVFPRCKVLCVDDNAAAVEVRAGLLELHGYEVETLTDERQTLLYLEANPVNVVVLDYLMPEIRGDQLATLLRQRYPKLPILLISGAIDAPASIGGADLFISKEGGHQRLLRVLSELTKAGEIPCGEAAKAAGKNGVAA